MPSGFLEISNVIKHAVDFSNSELFEIDSNKSLLSSVYFSQLVYFSWKFVIRKLKQIQGYVSHEIYDIGSTEAFFVEFDHDCWVSFRGTQRTYVEDYLVIFSFWQTQYHDTKVHRGFANSLGSVRNPILARILQARHDGKRIHFCGHSMGGALATLMCLYFVPDSCVVYGCPKLITGKRYASYYNQINYLRVETDWDPVTILPFRVPYMSDFRHVGRSLRVELGFSIFNHFVKRYLRAILDSYYHEALDIPADVLATALPADRKDYQQPK